METREFAVNAVVIVVFKLVDDIMIKGRRFQKFAEEEPTRLIKYVALVDEGLEKSGITKGELFSQMHIDSNED